MPFNSDDRRLLKEVSDNLIKAGTDLKEVESLVAVRPQLQSLKSGVDGLTSAVKELIEELKQPSRTDMTAEEEAALFEKLKIKLGNVQALANPPV